MESLQSLHNFVTTAVAGDGGPASGPQIEVTPWSPCLLQRRLALILSSAAEPGHSAVSSSVLSGVATVSR
ncbi:hypothetical protein V1289_002371 [Bradyrhizobium sp. AZCC 2289]